MSTKSTTSPPAGRGLKHALTASALALGALLLPLGAPPAHATEEPTPAPVIGPTVSPPPDLRTTRDPHIESAPGLGCKLDCITFVHVDEADGDWAHFVIKTNTPVTLTLSAGPITGNGQWTTHGPVTASAATDVPTQSWTPTLTGLTPTTQYGFKVTARDSWGNEHSVSQHFYTPSA